MNVVVLLEVSLHTLHLTSLYFIVNVLIIELLLYIIIIYMALFNSGGQGSLRLSISIKKKAVTMMCDGG